MSGIWEGQVVCGMCVVGMSGEWYVGGMRVMSSMWEG